MEIVHLVHKSLKLIFKMAVYILDTRRVHDDFSKNYTQHVESLLLT